MDERAKQILGKRVEQTRRDLGISKVDFCVATGISRPYLDRIEDGTANFTLKVLFKIAPALGMTVSELLMKFLSKRLSKVINIDNYIELPGNVKSF